MTASMLWDTPEGVRFCGGPALANGELPCQLWDPKTGSVAGKGSVPELLDFGIHAAMPGGRLWIGQGNPSELDNFPDIPTFQVSPLSLLQTSLLSSQFCGKNSFVLI